MVFPISLIPMKIVSVSWFVIGTLLPPVSEALALFGLQSRTIVLNRTECVLAYKVYVMKGMPSPFYTWTVRQCFRALAVQKWGLDTAAPTGAGVVNRPKRTSRHVADLENLTAEWRQRWPKHRWEYHLLFPSFRAAAQWFNVQRVTVCTTGAGCLNALFMQNGSCFAELQSNMCFDFFLHLAASVGLDYIVMKVPQMQHWVPSAAALGKEMAEQLVTFIVNKYFQDSS
jgi:hypothetical protein